MILPPLNTPGIDFETYSEAGYCFDEETKKWRGIAKNSNGWKAGLSVVGTYVYAEHPSAEVTHLAYTTVAGAAPKLWVPGMPPPVELFDYIAEGGLLAAWHSMFEFLIWHFVCVHKMGWPALPLDQLRCTMARGAAFSLPGKLEKAGPLLGVADLKDKEGSAVMRRVSVPRTPTKNKKYHRHTPTNSPDDFAKMCSYVIDDVKAEAAVGSMVPDLSPTELEIWQTDQRINARGVYMDKPLIEAAMEVVAQVTRLGNEELRDLTGGHVPEATKITRIVEWCKSQGLNMLNGQAETIEAYLKQDLPPNIKRVLEIRASLGSAAVKKLPAMHRQLGNDGRIHGLFKYCGARMTGRWSGADVQPHNLVNSGPSVVKCLECGAVTQYAEYCARCWGKVQPLDWGIEGMEAVIPSIMTGSADMVASQWGDPIDAVSGCLRGCFTAAPGHEFIGSDYSAIEAVGAAAITGEQWRLDVFNSHGLIYEMSASKITGVPFEEFLRHKEQTGQDHPLRKKIGKIAELASGYQGWVGSWKVFGADKIMDDEEIKEAVIAWRDASPKFPETWAGLQDAAHKATLAPGQCFQYAGIVYGVTGDILYCQLHSGRTLKYHTPRIVQETNPYNGRPRLTLSFEGWNTDPKRGPQNQWLRMQTHGGRLFENIDQAESRDILAEALVRLEKKGYPIVLHVHDEAIAEVPAGLGSVEQFEEIMAERPHWAQHWPIRASGGWRGHRYRKG